MIFNTDCNEFQYFNGTVWKTLGSASGLIASPGAINGSTSVCALANGVTYSAAAVQDATSYTWTVPAGATIASGQGTNAIVVNYGASGGSVCVTANNACYNSSPTCVSVTVSPSMTAPLVYSNYITMTVFSTFPGAPAEGTHISGVNAITWTWNTAANTTGYKWNTTNGYATVTDMGTATTKTETGLTCGTA
jgi:hypothetical protein